MFDYGEACPISMATSVLCERWTLQIIREIFLGSTRYSEIQKYIPNLSPSLLRTRLRFLEDQGIVLRKKSSTPGRFEYHLTPAGKALAPVLTELGRWGMRYANQGMTDKHNTVSGLIRDFAGAINVDELPSCDVIIQFNLTDMEGSPKRYVNVRNGVAQECSQDLGFDVDIYITASVRTLTKVWYGELDIRQAMEEGSAKVVAPPAFLRTIRRWLGISSFTTDNPSFATK